jgi:hypothetical protein
MCGTTSKLMPSSFATSSRLVPVPSSRTWMSVRGEVLPVRVGLLANHLDNLGQALAAHLDVVDHPAFLTDGLVEADSHGVADA